MKLPDKIMLRGTLFADGAKGMALQVRVNDPFGISVTSSRESRKHEFEHKITMAGVDGVFASFEELREAVAGVDRDQADYIRQLESVGAGQDEIDEAKGTPPKC